MTFPTRNMISSSSIRMAFIAAAILSAALITSAKADVSFNGTNFSGGGIYSEAVNSTSNLTATPDSGQTITFNNNIVSTGNFTQTGENVVFNSGTNNSFNMLYVNNGSGNGAKMTLSGSMNLTELHVANARTTHLAITEGATLNVSGIAYINEAKNAQGVITQTGGDVSFTTSGSSAVRIGHWPNTGYPSRYDISGGTLSIPNTMTYVGWDGYAEMNISGGTVTLKGLSLSNSANSKGTLRVTGGTLNMGADGVSRNKRGASGSIEPVLNFGNGTINATASHTWASNLNITLNDSATTTLNADADKTITLASKLAGSGSIRKTGDGTLILSNANTYTGTTTVDGGTLKFTGNGVPGTGSSVTVDGTVEYAYSDDKTIDYPIYGSGNLVKSGEYALTLPSYSAYSGKTTVSEGTLILQDSSNFSSSEVEVKTGSYFKAGFNLDNTSINVNGGNFVLGTDNNSSVGVVVPDITVSNGGIVSFNMIDYTDVWYGYDYLEINDSASMTSGYLNLVFNQDSNLWYDNITDDGYELITFKGNSDDFTFTNMGVLVNGTSTSKWRLEKTDDGVFLMKGSDGPAPVTPYWNANNGDDLALGQWTIDHNPKLGVQFIEGTNTAAEYTGTVVMSENASYEVGDGKLLKMSGVISDSGSMEKLGAGTLYLSAANTYSGGTTISSGSVTISNPNALGTGAVTINGGALDATPAGNTQTFNNDIIVGDNGATVSVATGEYSSFKSISGSGDLTTNGYIHFNGNGGYNGHLTVASGFTRVNPGAFGVFDLTINQGGRFNIYDSGTVQIGKLNSTADVEVFGSKDVNVYTFEIGTGTTSSDSASFAGYIRGLPDKRNVTIRKVGEGTQTFCRTGYGYAGTNNSLNEIIIDGGKMVINANHSVFSANSTTGYWGTAPITVNEGGTLEYARNWNTSPNTMLTVNGGTLALNSTQYQNLLTLNSATVNGTGQLRAGYVGSGTWTVKGGTSTIDTSISLVLKGNYNTLTVNFDSGSTLDIKKNLSGLDGYTGTAVVFNGTGNAPGNINFNSAAGAVTGLGAFTFNNMNATISYGTSWLGNGYFSGSSVTVKNSTLTTSCDHSTNNTVITLDNGVLNFDGKVNSYAHQIYMKNGSSITGTQFSAGHNWNSQFITQYENGTPENVMNEISADIAMYNTGRTITFNVADKAPLTVSGSLIPMDPGHYNALDKTGAGTLTLTAPNSHSTTTVSEGTLVLSGNGTFGTGNVVNNAAVVFAHNSEQTLTNAISGTGTVAKTGSGKLTVSSANTYSGDTTVSGGTLVLASSGSLATPNIIVESGATFQAGANLASTNVALNGGSFVLGTSSSAAEITIADFALNGGTVNFDFYAATSTTNYDYLFTNAANLTSGAININFANNDELTWWNNASGGYILIDTLGISGSLDNIELLVNSAQTSNWYLDTTGNYIVMKKQNDAPPVEDPYYLANTEEAISADKWTIDGQDKKGVKFTEGDENAVTYGKEVEMDANGTVEVGENRNLTLAGVVSGEGNVTKLGDGKLTLSGDNTYSGDTIVSDGTLTLTGDAVKANSSIEIADDATLEYNVAQGDSKQLTFTDDVSVSGGNVVKTGKGTLKILATDGLFESNKFDVEAGELDFKGDYNGDLEVKEGATLSPGNSVGDLSVTGNVVIDASGTLLFEFSQYNDNPDMQEFDTLSIENASNELVLDTNSIIKLFFTSASDANLWAAEGAQYKLVSDEGFVDDITNMSDLLGNYNTLFRLEGRTDGLYLIGLGAGPAPEPGSGVPEPSTWALLALGVIVLFLRKRVRN